MIFSRWTTILLNSEQREEMKKKEKYVESKKNFRSVR